MSNFKETGDWRDFDDEELISIMKRIMERTECEQNMHMIMLNRHFNDICKVIDIYPTDREEWVTRLKNQI